ncbi:hypothetical protein [Limnoglobus roseus]|uniref:hypothetical protein n=1 Tax=Limnoglobus roseus TaxID=2598579 RepID=UPI0011EB144F|nr:hypothetical protein [Limnoglobus roseus]
MDLPQERPLRGAHGLPQFGAAVAVDGRDDGRAVLARLQRLIVLLLADDVFANALDERPRDRPAGESLGSHDHGRQRRRGVGGREAVVRWVERAEGVRFREVPHASLEHKAFHISRQTGRFPFPLRAAFFHTDRFKLQLAEGQPLAEFYPQFGRDRLVRVHRQGRDFLRVGLTVLAEEVGDR